MKERLEKRGCILFVVLFLLLPIPVQSLYSDIEWVNPRTSILHMGDTLEREGYTIEATDILNQSAFISIYDKKGDRVFEAVMGAGDVSVFNNILNITLVKVNYTEPVFGSGIVEADTWVKIRVRVRGRPGIRVTVFTDQEEYTPGDTITVNASVVNTGRAILKRAFLEVNSTLPLREMPEGRWGFAGDRIIFDLHELEAGESSPIYQIRFKAPSNLTGQSYLITARAWGEDVLGEKYEKTDKTTAHILPAHRVELVKYASEKIYLGDTAYITITARNNGSIPIPHATLTDTLPPDLQGNTTLTWNLTLPPGGQKSITYQVKPRPPGTILTPPATLRWQLQGVNYTLRSNTPKIIVSGPEVTAVKKADPKQLTQGETATITLTLKNSGDLAAVVTVKDTLPSNATLKTGSPNWSGILYPEEPRTLTYTLQFNQTGTYNLPPAQLEIIDKPHYTPGYRQSRYYHKKTTNKATIRVLRKEHPLTITPRPRETPLLSTPSPPGQPPPEQPQPPKETPGFSLPLTLAIVYILIKLKLDR